MNERHDDTQTTGDERVDAVLARLDDLDDLDLPDQLAVFSEMQACLASILDTDPDLGDSGVTGSAGTLAPASTP